jgi:hypothetical protein
MDLTKSNAYPVKNGRSKNTESIQKPNLLFWTSPTKYKLSYGLQTWAAGWAASVTR